VATTGWLECDKGVTNFSVFRTFFPADTSSIGAGQEIISPSKIYFTPSSNPADNYTESISVVQTTQASNTTLAVEDFDAVGTTKGATDILLGSLAENTGTSMTLNSTGYGFVSLTGYTKMGLRMTNKDLGNSEPATGNSYVGIAFSEHATSAYRPYYSLTWQVITTATGSYFHFM
jgi:hypothetical protein